MFFNESCFDGNPRWVSTDKTVRKIVLKTGEFSKTPTECSICEIIVGQVVSNTSTKVLEEKYNSAFVNCTSKWLTIGEADSEIDRKIERAIQTMKVSEKSLVSVDIVSDVNEQIEITVQLEITLAQLKPHKPIWEWTPEEKYTLALKYKERGVRLFKESRCVDAFHKFSRACKILITLEPIPDLELDNKLENDIKSLRLILYNNMAGCHLNQRNYEHTVALCNKILDKERNNVKALYRRGVSYGNLKDLEKAVADLKNVLILEPYNRIAMEQFLIYNTKLQEANQKFEDMVRRMFKT